MNQRHLDDYLARIAYKGTLATTVPVLHALTQAHAQSVPFENVDVLLGRPIDLSHDMLLRKLVELRQEEAGVLFEATVK